MKKKKLRCLQHKTCEWGNLVLYCYEGCGGVEEDVCRGGGMGQSGRCRGQNPARGMEMKYYALHIAHP